MHAQQVSSRRMNNGDFYASWASCSKLGYRLGIHRCTTRGISCLTWMAESKNSPRVKKSMYQRSAKSCVFPPSISLSTHRES